MGVRKKTGTLGRRLGGFSLVELIVVITILAILATIGLLALSGYSQDAKTTTVKSNARSVLTAISSESSITGNSPRYYVVHDTWASVSWGLVFVDGQAVTLTGWNWNAPNTNYSAGNPDFVKLKLNPEKFRLSGLPLFFTNVSADFDNKKLSVGAVDIRTVSSGGKSKSNSWIQVAWIIPATGHAVVYGNYPSPSQNESSSWAVSGLLGNPKEPTKGLVDGQITTVVSPTPNVVTAAPTWSTCPVGATCSWAVAEYKTAGSNAFQVPANWTYELLVVGWGGAGGSAYWGGGAGWAGGYADEVTATLTSGQTLTIVVGAGWTPGAGGWTDWTGGAWWVSSVGALVSANGGGGGQNGGTTGNTVSTLSNTAGGTCWGKSGGGYDSGAVKSKGCDGQTYYSTFDSNVSHGIGGQPTNNYGAEGDAGGGGWWGFWTEGKTSACSNWGTAATWHGAGWSGAGGDDNWLACQHGASGYVRITKINTN